MRGLGAAALVAAVAACGSAPVAGGPRPDMTPTEVIAAQLVALKQNGPDNAGIARAFRFASPANRAPTGPLPRFVRMIRQGFPDMLTFQEIAFAPLVTEDDQAMQMVTLIQPDGRRQAYLFRLRRTDARECDHCWLVDGVQPVVPEAPPPVEGGTI